MGGTVLLVHLSHSAGCALPLRLFSLWPIQPRVRVFTGFGAFPQLTRLVWEPQDAPHLPTPGLPHALWKRGLARTPSLRPVPK